MVLQRVRADPSGLSFRILATDISTTVLAKADAGSLSNGVVQPVPAALKRKYLMRSREPDSDRCAWFRNCAQLIEFRRLEFHGRRLRLRREGRTRSSAAT